MNNTRWISRTSWVCFLFLLVALTIPALGQDAPAGKTKAMVVTLKDGRAFTGTVTERDDGIEVKTKLATLRFARNEIVSIQPVVAAKDAYLARKDATDKNDAKALYGLAKWVWENHGDNKTLLLYARDDLKSALKINKDYTRAKLLLRQVNAKIGSLDTGETTGPKPGTALAMGDRDLVTGQDIFWIRLQELRPKDRVMIQYKNKALKRYVDGMRGRQIDNWDLLGKERKFLAQPRNVQVMEILRNKQDDAKLLQDIHVMSDPRFMNDFRSRVWPILQKSCAAANCHGGPEANGGLKFFVLSGTNSRVEYTNFLIVSGWRKGKSRLLDRQNLESSLILQYGLNRRVSQKPHPVEIPPVFTNTRAANYRRVHKWMRSLQKPLSPDYHIHAGYAPAGMKLDTSGTPLMADDKEE